MKDIMSNMMKFMDHDTIAKLHTLNREFSGWDYETIHSSCSRVTNLRAKCLYLYCDTYEPVILTNCQIDRVFIRYRELDKVAHNPINTATSDIGIINIEAPHEGEYQIKSGTKLGLTLYSYNLVDFYRDVDLTLKYDFGDTNHIYHLIILYDCTGNISGYALILIKNMPNLQIITMYNLYIAYCVKIQVPNVRDLRIFNEPHLFNITQNMTTYCTIEAENVLEYLETKMIKFDPRSDEEGSIRALYPYILDENFSLRPEILRQAKIVPLSVINNDKLPLSNVSIIKVDKNVSQQDITAKLSKENFPNLLGLVLHNNLLYYLGVQVKFVHIYNMLPDTPVSVNDLQAKILIVETEFSGAITCEMREIETLLTKFSDSRAIEKYLPALKCIITPANEDYYVSIPEREPNTRVTKLIIGNPWITPAARKKLQTIYPNATVETHYSRNYHRDVWLYKLLESF